MDDQVIQVCNKFKYLGEIITKEDNCDKSDINVRNANRKQVTKALDGLLWIKNITGNRKSKKT